MWGLEQDTFVAYAHGGSAPYAKKASPGLLSFLAFAKGKGRVTALGCVGVARAQWERRSVSDVSLCLQKTSEASGDSMEEWRGWTGEPGPQAHGPLATVLLEGERMVVEKEEESTSTGPCHEQRAPSDPADPPTIPSGGEFGVYLVTID